MYQSVLSRREEYRKKKEKRIRTIRRTVPVLACFCFTVMIGLRFWDDLAKLSHFPIQPDIVDEPMIESSESAITADTTESGSTDQTIITDAVSTTISAQNSQTDMVATTGPPQTQTVTTAVSGEESGRETEQETIEHTETQAPVEDTMPNADVQTTAAVTYTQPIIVAQTTSPAQTTVEIPTSIVIQTEPTTTEATKPPDNVQEPVAPAPELTTTEATKPSDIVLEPAETTQPSNSVQEPVAPPAQPIPFDDITTVADAIHNNDVSSYPEHDQKAYLRMFERIRNDDFVYMASGNELISLREDLSIYLFPYNEYEDIGIGYYVAYKGKLYHVMFCYADPYIISSTDGIAEYLKKRMGRRSDKEIIIQNQTVSEFITNDSKIYASSFIDLNHYYDIVTSASEDELIEFLSIFSYEKIQL